jgi:hypothetical protein
MGKRDTISMRLGFWLDRPLTGAEAKAWLTGTIADCAIYTPNQVIYAAKPIFLHGRVDPVGERSGILGGRPTVTAPPIAKPMLRVRYRAPSKPVSFAATVLALVQQPEVSSKILRRKPLEGVIFDTEAAIAAGSAVIKHALASDEWRDQGATPTGARAYRLAASLKDEALSPATIVNLLVEMVPWFDEEDRPLITAMVESAYVHGQNEPGCGPPNDLTRLLGAITAEWEAEAVKDKELWDQVIENSQGALQRLPDAPPPAEFPPAFTEEVRRIISEDRAELARRLK